MEQQHKGFTKRDSGQKLVNMLDGNRTRNNGYVQSSSQRPITENNIPPLRSSSTSISVRKTIQKTPRINNVMRKQETISGNHTTHIRKSTHRVEQHSSRILQQQQQQRSTSRPQQYEERTLNRGQVLGNSQVDDEDYDSDDIFDSEKADLELLKLVKKTLLSYIENMPSGKLKSGEYTWSEIKPYIREMHFPRFRKYLIDREIQAPPGTIVRCLKDLHISRRDGWLKKQRKLREQRSREEIDNVEAQPPRSDGYVAFKPKPRRDIRN